jgi:dUTP pyrophosphatase
MKIPLIKLDPELPTPRRAHRGDAGVDLYAREPVTLAPGAWRAVPTGVAVEIPEDYVGLVAPRSGLAVHHGISIVNSPGVIDSGYRGEIKAVLVNHGNETVVLDRGARIAQLLVIAVTAPDFEEVEFLEESDRSDGGFGSTGA